MHIVIFAKLEDDSDILTVKRVTARLDAAKVGYDLTSVSETELFGRKLKRLSDCVYKADYIVVLGGDGTVLTAVKEARLNNVPILCINTGTVGFLTEVEDAEIEFAVDKLLAEDFSIEERTMLEVGYNGETFYALNDVVLSKGSNTRPISITVEYDGKFLDKYLADGLIVSTPTGSTGYSLSAGGPILAPDIKALIINTICAHSLHSRPIVMADSHEISVFAPKLFSDAELIVDGCFVADVSKNSAASVRKADRCARFVRIKDDRFYEKLLKKLNYWGVTRIN